MAVGKHTNYQRASGRAGSPCATGLAVNSAPALGPYVVLCAVPTSPYNARLGTRILHLPALGRGGRGYAPRWAGPDLLNHIWDMKPLYSRFRNEPIIPPGSLLGLKRPSGLPRRP
jgi:hypothetical protein